MRIRSVTAFADITYPLEPGAVKELGTALQAAKHALQDAGFDVQTTRLASQPFPDALESAGPSRAADLAKDVEAVTFVHEIDYAALGPARLDDPPAYAEAVLEIFEATENVFASVEIANSEQGTNLSRLRRAADLIRRVSTLGEGGFVNLRFAALANVQPWSPFFPAAYHGGGDPCLAVAMEGADLALTAISGASSLADARASLVQAIESGAKRVQGIVEKAIGSADVKFRGIDFSLAPYPEESRSIGAALEALGLPAVGAQGSLMAAAFLTDAIDRAKFKRTGFCGLMLPVLEDSVLAQRAAEGKLSVMELLMLSAVCGTGLDTIPLPGSMSRDELAAILMDVAALALRLDKPLTARLMPIPGKDAGDETGFEFEYFANSRVMAPVPEPLSGLLAGDESIGLRSLAERP